MKTVPQEVKAEVDYMGVLPITFEGAPAQEVKQRSGRCARLVRSYIEALSRKVAFCPAVVLVVSVLLVILFGLGISLDITLATGVGLSVAGFQP